MPKPPKKPKLSTGKATKPELKPLDTYLADLLNPAINRERERFPEAPAAGFAEQPQATYAHGEVTDVDPTLAKKLGLKGPEDGPDAAEELGGLAPDGVSGVSATVSSLTRLLTDGNPLFKDGKLWTPHRPPRPEKSEGGIRFQIKSEFEPAGDQPDAIAELVDGVRRQERDQVLLGVTGSGKTFTMAKVIEDTQRPALILAPNKTLAAQLYGEFKSFFPDNAVEYFVSYYDYYQPEAYVPRSDTYIEKELSINEQIDRMRHAATRALLERDDVIIVAPATCASTASARSRPTRRCRFRSRSARNSSSASSSRISSPCNTSVFSWISRAAPSGCAAILSSSGPPTWKIAAGASGSSATRSSSSSSSTRSPGKRSAI